MRKVLLLATFFVGTTLLFGCTNQQMSNGKDPHSPAVADFGSGGGGGGGGY